MPRRNAPQKTVTITNPHKLMFPGAAVTKRDVIDYYVAIAPVLLPHLAGRPVTLKRYPDGVRGQAFYEKDIPSFAPPWVRTAPVWRRSGESQIHYVVIDDVETLTWCAQIASIELHPFLHRAPHIDRPTAVVFDLDPGEGASILECADVAFRIRDTLDARGLTSFVKVSGSKGLQVYVPLNTPVTYEATQPFARALAEELERAHPERIVSRMARALRAGKVFVDWSQNADFKTTAGVYSMRAKRDQPFISLPVTWEELARARKKNAPDTLYWSAAAALQRVATIGDLFAGVLTLKQRLPDTVSRPHIVRRAAARGARPDVAVPQRSRQGGRRRYLFQATDDGALLHLETGDRFATWRFSETPRPAQKAYAGGLRTEAYDPARFPADAQRAADAGTVETVEGSIRSGDARLYFSGGRVLSGEWQLRRSGSAWRLVRTAVPKTTTTRANEPRTRAATKPAYVAPMTATLVDALPEGPDWLYEVKLDGYRVIAVKSGGRVQLLSRRGNDLTADYPTVTTAVAALDADGAVVDGEIVALDKNGTPSFQLLQHRTARPRIVYYAFDLLHLDGEDLRAVPLEERKRRLAPVVHGSGVLLSEPLTGTAREVERAIANLNLEGVIAKRRSSTYQPGKRTDAWVKRKLIQRQEFVIGGYKPGYGTFESLIVGYYKDGKLWFAGKVRNGYTPALRAQLWATLKTLRTGKYPFADKPVRRQSHWGEGLTTEDMTTLRWLEPVIVAEVGYVEWTAEGRLRHSTFLGLRPDKDARDVRREEAKVS
jgi:bifunctional non-homologous end joining protein LigD